MSRLMACRRLMTAAKASAGAARPATAFPPRHSSTDLEGRAISNVMGKKVDRRAVSEMKEQLWADIKYDMSTVLEEFARKLAKDTDGFRRLS